MYYHLDNFAVYDTVRTTGTADTTWLTKVYQLNQSAVTNLRIQQWSSGRIGIGTVAAFTGTRSLYLPVGRFLDPARPNINVTMRLLDYVPNGTAIAGLSLVSPVQDDHILSFGFIDPKTGFVRYVGKDGVVRNDVFFMQVSLSGVDDVIEWGFEKSVNDQSVYKPFILWVNNRPVYVQEAFCQIGSPYTLSVRLLGGVNALAAGATSTSGFINLAGNVTVPKCGVTDVVINDGARNGLVRVLNRASTNDIGPNTMSSTDPGSSHASLVGATPPDAAKYLTAVTALAEELYGASAFDGLSSEAILAFGVQVVGSKNNPFALDLGATVRVNGVMRDLGPIALDILPGFATAISEVNPLTGRSWTALEANSANFGLKVT